MAAMSFGIGDVLQGMKIVSDSFREPLNSTNDLYSLRLREHGLCILRT